MRGILWEQRKTGVVAAVTRIVVGLLLLFWTGLSVDILSTVLGVVLLMVDVWYWIAWRKLGAPVWLLLPAVIQMGLGVWLLAHPSGVITVIQYIVAVILAFHGLLDLQAAFVLVRAGQTRWWIDLILALMTLGMGALIFFNPTGSFQLLLKIMGICLVFDGGSDFRIIWRLGRAVRTMEEAADEIIVEEEL